MQRYCLHSQRGCTGSSILSTSICESLICLSLHGLITTLLASRTACIIQIPVRMMRAKEANLWVADKGMIVALSLDPKIASSILVTGCIQCSRAESTGETWQRQKEPFERACKRFLNVQALAPVSR